VDEIEAPRHEQDAARFADVHRVRGDRVGDQRM
jgi:hypothetical protein